MQLNELQQAIRYAISQLSALNGQMDFEKICLYFARERIHKNILPATGPVQAGGDQGRDFETFHSYLANSSIGNSSFIGMFSKNQVAFACSLEKNPTRKNGKIHSDVKTIIASGSKVERIYFFSGEDIPVGKRHKIQEEIKAEFETELEVIDGQALSQHLADQDLFWIAIQFLKIPSEYYPERTEINWYSKLVHEYKVRPEPPKTFQEFSDIKGAIRHIYKKKEFRSDLLFWLEKLDLVIHDSRFPEYLVRKAIYEKFVACIMGLDNVEGQETNIEKYYLDFESYSTPADLEDAQVLLSFLWNSMLLGRHRIKKEYLTGIGSRLEELLKLKIKRVETVDTKCALLEIYANFLFHDQRNKKDFAFNGPRYISKLKEIAPLLRRTHFFPISLFSDRLNQMIAIFFDLAFDPAELELQARKVDDILASKAGSAIVAEKLRSRAVAYMDNKKVFKSIETLHELKIKWFNKDTLKGSILTCLLLADAYRKLNLFFAAKYYALVGSYLAVNSQEFDYSSMFLQGLSIAADCDYGSGSWFSFLILTDFLIISHFRMTKDFDVFDHEDTQRILFYPAIIQECSSSFLPATNEYIKTTISKWGFIKDEIQELHSKLKIDFKTADTEGFKKEILTQINGIPFNDVGKTRRVIFNAWGCVWEFNFANEYMLNGIAEEFISTFQIIVADLTETELYIVPTNTKAEIRLSTQGIGNFKQLPSNAESVWIIELASYSGTTLVELNKHQFNYLVIAQALIFEISLLPLAEYQKIIGKKLKDENLIGKGSFGRPYEDLYHNFIAEQEFKKSERWKYDSFAIPISYEPITNKKLPWKSALAAKYNRQSSLKDINNRIDALEKVLSLSLPGLKSDKEFKQIITQIKELGWLDWQILHVLGTILVNYKGQFKGSPVSPEDAQRRFYSYFIKDEKEWFKPIPKNLFTFHLIKQHLESIFVASILPSFGLEFHSETPNGNAIIRLLKERFNFFEDGKEIAIFSK